MAKKSNPSSYNPRPFRVMAIVLFLFTVVNMFIVFMTFRGTVATFTGTSQAMNHINTANGNLLNVNKNVLMIVGNVGETESSAQGISQNMQNLIQDIANGFDTIDEEAYEFEQLDNISDDAKARFHQAYLYTVQYHQKMLDYQVTLKEGAYAAQVAEASGNTAAKQQAAQQIAAFRQQMPNIYIQEIHPLQVTASELMTAAIAIASADSGRTIAVAYQRFMLVLGLMLLLLIIGEVATYLIARANRRAAEELDRRSAQVAEASAKLMHSREKMEDIAVTNILTGMKNRYALEADIGDKLENEQFNIAVFDLDNFRSINDVYGYDFGDEYLSQISERLKEEFGQHAELYNITGNEFCVVFNREVSDTQAVRLVENIAGVLSSPYNVFNISVQLTVSGCSYHYLPGDCLNLNSLLVKMDNVLRMVKRNGGAQIQSVNGI